MAWLELHQQLRRHPKLLHLAELLGVEDPDLVRAKLENIWLWALDYAEAGVFRIVKDGKQERAIVDSVDGHGRPIKVPCLTLGGFMAQASGWHGDALAFSNALLQSGWIDRIKWGHWGQELQIHDWQEYTGMIVERRRRDRERKRVANSAGIPVLPYPTVPNRTQPEEEEAARAAPPPPPPVAAQPGTAQDGGPDETPPPAPPPPQPAIRGDQQESIPAPEVDRDFPFGGGAFPMSGELQAVFDGIPKPSNGAVKHPEPTPQDTVIRVLMRAAMDVAKMPNKPATIRPVLEAMRARYGAQHVEEWLMNPANIGKNTIELQDELKVLHKGNDVAAKIRLQKTSDQRIAARAQVLKKIQDFLESHSKECTGCRDCNRDRIALIEAGIPKSKIPQPKKKE